MAARKCLPWHGKSSPPPGFETEAYRLTTDRYVDTVMAVSRALGLERPVVMGCSIGGRAVLTCIEQIQHWPTPLFRVSGRKIERIRLRNRGRCARDLVDDLTFREILREGPPNAQASGQ